MEETGFIDILDDILEILIVSPQEPLATTHLLLASFAQIQFQKILNKPYSPLLGEYLDKVKIFLEDCLQKTPPARTLFDGAMATYAFFNLFPEAAGPTDITQLQWLFSKQVLDRVLDNYPEKIDNKTFREYFDDISFSPRKINSEKADKLVKEILKSIDEEMASRIEGSCSVEQSEKIIEQYRQSWKSANGKLKDIDYQIALLFYCLSLEMCLKYLSAKEYAKFQKTLLKAISAYKGNQNPMQKQFTFKNVTEAYEKLKEKIINLTTQEYIIGLDGSESLELFSLSSDMCLENMSKLTPPEASSLLEDVTVSGDKVLLGAYLQPYLETSYQSAKVKYEEITGNSTEEVKSNSALPDPKTGKETSIEETLDEEAQWNERLRWMKQSVEKLDYPHDIFFHALALRLMKTQGLARALYSDYQKSLKDLVREYNNPTYCDCEKDEKKVQLLRQVTDNNFEDVYRTLVDKLKGWRASMTSKEKALETIPYIFSVQAIEIATQHIAEVAEDPIKEAIGDFEYDDRSGEYFSKALSAYALEFTFVAHHYDRFKHPNR